MVPLKRLPERGREGKRGVFAVYNSGKSKVFKRISVKTELACSFASHLILWTAYVHAYGAVKLVNFVERSSPLLCLLKGSHAPRGRRSSSTQLKKKKKKKRRFINMSLWVKTRCRLHHTHNFHFLRSSEKCLGCCFYAPVRSPGRTREERRNSGLNDFPLVRCLKVNDSGRINDTSAHVGSCFFPLRAVFFFFFSPVPLMRDIPGVEDFRITVFSSRLKPH